MMTKNITIHQCLRAIGLILALFVVSSTSSDAQTRIHEVKQGETLVSIAQAYQMTATELRVLNKLQNERIEIGQKLRVRDVDPVWPSTSSQATTGVGIDPNRIESQVRRDTTQRTNRSAETARPTETTPVANQSATQPESGLVESEHVVRPGETLFSIANRYGMLVADLKRRNGIVGNDITAGQRLKVMVPVQEQQPVTQAPPPPVQNVDVGRTQEQPSPQQAFNPDKHEWYIVKASDTLPSIARAFDMSVAQMRDLNGSMIYTMGAGDRIIVHRKQSPDSTVRETSTEQGQAQPPVQTDPPVRAQPPSTELKPPVEHVDPPQVVEQTTEVATDSSTAAVEVEPFDPFGNSVNRGRFIGYTVKRNERLANILDTFKMDESDFYALNPSLEGRPPRVGTEVLVYEPPSNIQQNPYAVDARSAGVGMSIEAQTYTEGDRGKLTSSGELYSPDNLTAASSTFALGSILYVLNPETGKGTYVRVNDKTDLDGIILSKMAASVLGLRDGNPSRVVVSKEN